MDAHLFRAGDPLTSALAADRTPKFASGHHALILNALRRGPATPHELQRPTGLTVVQIDRRLPELKRAGLARVVQAAGQDVSRGGSRVWEAL